MVDLNLLRRHLSLQILFLLLPRLHLIVDQSAAEQPDSGADAGAAMAAINTVPKLGEGDSSNKASQACLDFFALQTIARGCPA
jgi:hypothetical protein